MEPEADTGVRFKDIRGIDEYKAELEELVSILKYPKQYSKQGAQLPKGVLLVGPPGTGKTLLARALAGEAGCSFFYSSGSELQGQYIGQSADTIKRLFKAAR